MTVGKLARLTANAAEYEMCEPGEPPLPLGYAAANRTSLASCGHFPAWRWKGGGTCGTLRLVNCGGIQKEVSGLR